MRNSLFLLIFLSCSFGVFAQEEAGSTKEPKWHIAPALSINPAKATMGVANVGLGVLTTYQAHNNWVLGNYTMFQNVWAYPHSGFNTNLQTSYNVNFNHLYGGGYAFHGKKSINFLQFLVGLNYHQYRESIDNAALNLAYTYTSPAYVGLNYGLMWNSRKRVGKKVEFTIRYFFPLRNGLAMVDNVNQSALDIGVNIRLGQ